MIARLILRMAADAHTGHQNRLLDLAEAVDADVGAQDASAHAAARDDAAVRDDGIERLSTTAPFFCEHELRRRRLWLVGTQRPFRIVEIELRVHLTQIHAGFVVRVERSDVAPVLRGFLVLVVEAVRKHRRLFDKRRDDVLPEIVLAVGACGIALKHPHQDVGLEDVDPHRRERDVR